ncbi:sperm microtubule associated protein 2-like isoform X1 [Balearica regulorum gibbericeps]|uniref:sperm microtubule associated protein 2-like isoform X1 n=1 Tax=Balearica regulorum gibbericeps TaxID=100784 RepID=UPI003F6485C0
MHSHKGWRQRHRGSRVRYGFECSSSFFMLCWFNCMCNGTFVLFCNFDRIQELAEPKKVACANDPRLVWGNQETIWTLSRHAVTAQPSPRTVALAKPKQDFGKHQCSCGQESMICERPPLVNFGFLSDRLLKLSEPKKYQAAYLQQRPRQSPEWPVSPAALSYKASPRILELARPKVLHPEFLYAREVPTQVTNVVAMARASSRLQRLAEPRVRKVTCCYELSFPESVIHPVRQHRPGPCTAGMLGRGEGTGTQWLAALCMAALPVLLPVSLMSLLPGLESRTRPPSRT